MADAAMKKLRSILSAGCAAAVLGSAACGSVKLTPADALEMKFPLVAQNKDSGLGPMIPAIVAGPGGQFLVASHSGYLQAFDPANTEKKTYVWKYYAKTSETPPVVSEGRIFWASNEKKIFRLDDKGKLIWTKTLAESVSGEMAAVDKEIVFREGEKALSAFDPENGDILWRTEESSIGDWTADPTRILIRTTDNRLKVINPDGKVFKDIPLAEKAVGLLGLDGKRVFSGFADGRFGCVDLGRGKKRWSIRLGAETIGRPVSDGKQVYVVLSSQILAALDARRGHLLWWQPLAGRAAFTPKIVGEYVVVSSQSDKLQAFQRKTGKAETAYMASRELAGPVELSGTMLCAVSFHPVENYFLLHIFNLAPPAPVEIPPAK